MYGAQLIEALRSASRPPTLRAGLDGPEARPQTSSPHTSMEFFGAGGERMRAAGCEIVVDAKDLAVVGITEVLSRLPKIYGLFHRLIAEADQRKPDLAVVIDSPAFNWRVARQMHKRGIPVVYYVCPQFWAWRQGRVKLLRKYVNKALVIFPFEEKFYRDRGVDATFVGHPLADVPTPAITREAYAAQHALDAAKPWIALMPGSRPKEVRMNLPTILEAANRMGNGYEFLLPVACTLEPRFLKELMETRHGETQQTQQTQQAASLRGRPARHRVHLVPEALPALFHSRAGIVASGTATVEAALMGTPFVMVYRVSPLTYAVGTAAGQGPALCHGQPDRGRRGVPELVQHKFTAGNIVTEMNKIIPDGAPRARMIERLAQVKARLKQGSGAGKHAWETAAEIIMQMIR